MRKKKIGRAKPGKSVTRRVTRGPGKGDTVVFKANSAKSRNPGKLVPRRVLVDRGVKGTQKSLPKGKKKKATKRKKR